MTVVFDTNTLLHLLDEKLPPLVDPLGQPVSHVKERIDLLISEFHQRRDKIIIPTPALSELLLLAGDAGGEYFAKLNRAGVFKIEPFDTRAAIELALITAEAKAKGDKRAGSTESMAKIKFDRQIVAIASVNKATAIYSGDKNMKAFAEARKIRTIAVWDLPIPEQDAQTSLWDQLDAIQKATKEPEAE